LTKVAFLGLGEMGGPMASHVIAAGHDVALYDPVPAAVEARQAGSARAAATAADATSGSEVVCVVVRDDAQSLASIAGEHGVLESAAPGTIVLLHATVAPVTVRELADACDARGVRFVDAGISGGAHGATDGTLYVMCGGDPDTIDEARPVIDTYARHVVRFGEVGAGMAAKLARNFLHYQVWVAAYEGMALAEAAGLDLRAFEHLCLESGVPKLIELQLAKPTSASLDPGQDRERAAWAHKTIALGWKDLDDAIELAREVDRSEAIDAAVSAKWRYGPSMGLDVRPDGDEPQSV
jgi:3-hydroxyisobutyrate dehydrogenase-like beta-hydroxyacid dehydrogenase